MLKVSMADVNDCFLAAVHLHMQPVSDFLRWVGFNPFVSKVTFELLDHTAVFHLPLQPHHYQATQIYFGYSSFNVVIKAMIPPYSFKSFKSNKT